MSFVGKIITRGREKGGKCKTKRKKGENKEELKKILHARSRKTECCKRRENCHFRKGGDLYNIVFGAKYRPRYT
jgi:hypothetical protein